MKRHYLTIKCTAFAFLFGILVMALGSHIFSASETQAANIRDKRVVSVMVEKDDTIWKIARKYYTEECGSMKEYITEIKKCNSLDTDTIYAGYPLIIPVWVSEEEARQMQSTL